MRVTLFASSASPHVSQIYTGFSMLAQQGSIKLTQRFEHLFFRSDNSAWAFVNESTLVFFDLSDTSALNRDALSRCTAYFKRSYVSDVTYTAKVHPLGLNYEVYTGGFNRFELARLLSRRGSFRRTLARCAEQVGWSTIPTVTNTSDAPRYGQRPRVLFMARAWDPVGEGDVLTQTERQERVAINETRRACIEGLRKAFGADFYGGLAHSAYALKQYPHVLLPDAATSRKRDYLSRLQHYPICIATTGLHGSIGWKLGEYVASSKAIVSERLSAIVPGFAAGQHYHYFKTPEQCVEAVGRLMEDATARHRMMTDNWIYYQQALRPDRIVIRALLQVLVGSKRSPAPVFLMRERR